MSRIRERKAHAAAGVQVLAKNIERLTLTLTLTLPLTLTLTLTLTRSRPSPPPNVVVVVVVVVLGASQPGAQVSERASG